MRYAAIFLLLTGLAGAARVAVSQENSAPPQEPPAPAPSPVPQTETVGAPQSLPPAQAPVAAGPGYMEPAQVQALLHQVWLATFRINDLLSDLHPEHWKLDAAAAESFSRALDTLRAELGRLEEWRSQFEKRTESMYLGYETYAAIVALLPRLEGLAQAVTRHENSSLAAQYSEVENQFFDSQQAMEPYLRYLLRNQDQLLLANENGLAACQNQLSYAMRADVAPAKPMKNEHFIRPAHRHSAAAHPGGAGQASARKPARGAAGPKKPEAKAAAPNKPVAASPTVFPKPDQNAKER
jgi:hypothetical protein